MKVVIDYSKFDGANDTFFLHRTSHWTTTFAIELVVITDDKNRIVTIRLCSCSSTHAINGSFAKHTTYPPVFYNTLLFSNI